ncbi:uncharacterized protein LOC124363368 [Homalodisca vitripennis]|uniref:uncharacterized protein LOC124363368 n=1 Tax=Homalodisca vitripennis TaxID=197043 RepID=UPI001EEBA04A|nr:uncharacterized protein LOC124363368 [Homalodisca vitripennis]
MAKRCATAALDLQRQIFTQAQVVSMIKRKRKKGVLNKSEYKAEIIKKARVSGSSYISWTGKEVPEITPGEDCKCRRKCFTKVADEERKRIFETFRSLGSKMSKTTIYNL